MNALEVVGTVIVYAITTPIALLLLVGLWFGLTRGAQNMTYTSRALRRRNRKEH